MKLTLLPVVLLLSAVDLAAQVTVHYDSPTLAQPPRVAFPFYTPAGGATFQTTRVQVLCPASWLALQGVQPGIVTHVGLSIAGEATYSTFALRAGTASLAGLVAQWATNLPDQRVQVDLANRPIQGGGTAAAPVNAWVDFELAHPFVWMPGQDVVVDLTTRIAQPNVYLGTTTSPMVARAYSFDFQGGPDASLVSLSNGFVFRMQMAPLSLLPFGQGCAAGSAAPAVLGSTGSMVPGTQDLLLEATGATPGAFATFLVGFSRDLFQSQPLPLSFGSGCNLLVSADVNLTGVVGANGSVQQPILLPNWPGLVGVSLYAQFAQLELASVATLPVVFSNAGRLLIH